VEPECNLCLPKPEEFLNMFVEDKTGKMKNNDLFKRRILADLVFQKRRRIYSRNTCTQMKGDISYSEVRDERRAVQRV
jgi:hypothetical protein